MGGKEWKTQSLWYPVPKTCSALHWTFNQSLFCSNWKYENFLSVQIPLFLTSRLQQVHLAPSAKWVPNIPFVFLSPMFSSPQDKAISHLDYLKCCGQPSSIHMDFHTPCSAQKPKWSKVFSFLGSKSQRCCFSVFVSSKFSSHNKSQHYRDQLSFCLLWFPPAPPHTGPEVPIPLYLSMDLCR